MQATFSSFRIRVTDGSSCGEEMTMKTCPVCNSLAFDDAKTCFGCLHPFGDDDVAEVVQENKNRAGENLTRFVVSFTPVVEDGQTAWSCSVEPMAG